RGGPPSRGGGNTHKFYCSMGKDVEQKEIQLTIQGQTISSKYGNFLSARYNLEQLFSAGLKKEITSHKAKTFTSDELQLLESLSQDSHESYSKLRSHKMFVPYLEEVSPLSFFNKLNIASRPNKRKNAKKLTLEDLRAIPFVGAWTQMKQNIAGFYGLGSSIEKHFKEGKKQELKNLYKNSPFFNALVENAMQSLSKSYFPLTYYLQNDEKFSGFWELLYKEYKLACKNLTEVSGQKKLMEKDPLSSRSIQIREEIVLPLLVIQHYAMTKIREAKTQNKLQKNLNIDIYEKIILKALAANVNASRNSV
ncbi:MAG TPA: phosphoenolpyruvate carboxylase, partial [Vampirovibrionales bacterium]